MNINDPGDPDPGPNNLQNHPILTGFTQGRTSTTINGTLNSEPSSPYATFSYTPSQSIAGQWVTASATQKGTAGLTGLKATSEFFKGIKAP